MSTETELLDNLEDAQEAYDGSRRALRVLLPTGAVFLLATIGYFILLSYLHSLGVDWGDSSGFPGVLGLTVSTVALGSSMTLGLDALPDTRKALKQAQRAHRNHLMSDNREDTP